MLLDDVLSALDVHTIEWVVNRCLSGSLLQGRTVILVTHNLAMTKDLAKRVISLSSHGLASVKSSTEDALVQELAMLNDQPENGIEYHDQADNAKALEAPYENYPNGKLIAEEEVALGHISLSASKLRYYHYSAQPIGIDLPLDTQLCCISGTWGVFGSGSYSSRLQDVRISCLCMHPIHNSIPLALTAVASRRFQTWWLGFWARQYDDLPPEKVKISLYVWCSLSTITV